MEGQTDRGESSFILCPQLDGLTKRARERHYPLCITRSNCCEGVLNLAQEIERFDSGGGEARQSSCEAAD